MVSSMGASVSVIDFDGDGLLDKWETTSGLTDPNGVPLPDLPAMGADPNVKDIFVQVDYLQANSHKHLPSQKVIADVADAFDKAGAGAALRTVAVLPIVLTVVFGVLFLYYRARGGYRAVKLETSSTAA